MNSKAHPLFAHHFFVFTVLIVTCLITGSQAFSTDATWTVVTDTGPSERGLFGMVYDSADPKAVLFGGALGDTPFADTWEWDGSNWSQVASTGPQARYGFGMAYDAGRDKVVLFGGDRFNYVKLADTWEWDGSSWTNVSNSGPSGRRLSAMVYDSVREKIVLFGGEGDSSSDKYNDTWEWDGSTWTQVATNGPSARCSHAMAFDAARGKIVLFGGYDGAYNGETWEWDGTSWSQVSNTGPAIRGNHAMVYDTQREKVILFGGGEPSASQYYNDLWEWDGSAWTEINQSGPSERLGHGLIYDSVREKFVLFGGSYLSSYYSDTWESSIDSTPTLSLQPKPASVNRGETVEYTVHISDADNLQGYRITLDYDPSKMTYVTGSAERTGTSTETGWSEIQVNDTNPGQVLFASASATDPLPSGEAALLKFSMQVNGTLDDLTPLEITFNSKTSLNEEAIDFNAETWQSEVIGPNTAPSFTKGPDIAGIYEDSGAHSYPNWATDITAGQFNEDAWQDVSFIVTNDYNSLFDVQPSITPEGELSFTLAPDYNGTAQISVVLQDTGDTGPGNTNTSIAQSFTITVDAVNDKPLLDPIANQTIDEDSGIHTVTLTGIEDGDFELDQALTLGAVSDDTSIIPDPTIAYTQGESQATLSYTSNLNTNGEVTITVTITDDGSNDGLNVNTYQRTFTITVDPVNDAPLLDAIADQTVNEDSGLHTVTLTGIDDGDPELNQGLTLTAVSDNHTLIANPTIDYSQGESNATLSYTPLPDQNGTATITVTIQDDGLDGLPDVNSSVQTFTITVDPVNDAPTIVIADQIIDEDDVGIEVDMTSITDGDEDVVQSITVTASSGDTGLLLDPVVTYTSDESTGTLTLNTVADANGNTEVTVTVTDDGEGDAPHVNETIITFNVTVRPVNDQPSFTGGGNVEVVNHSGELQTIDPWAIDISAGPANESSQVMEFTVTANSHPGLFDVQPAIDPITGILTFTPQSDAHGVVTLTIILSDDGGTDWDGVDTSESYEFTITIIAPYLWGDLNANDIAGAVDASYILQFSAELITEFVGYPPIDYPEYYPPAEYPPANWDDYFNYFPPAADVNWDGQVGTVDASLVLQQYVELIDFFDADTNHDHYGPDDPPPPGKAASRQVVSERNLIASVSALDVQTWQLSLSVDNAEGLLGFKLGIQYDEAELNLSGEAMEWRVPGSGHIFQTNATKPGLFILAGALSAPMQSGSTKLVTINIQVLPGASAPLLLSFDPARTELNDGALPLNASSLQAIDLTNPTSVRNWMLH